MLTLGAFVSTVADRLGQVVGFVGAGLVLVAFEDDGVTEPVFYEDLVDVTCHGTCGFPTSSPTGMCYQCQCEAHAEGWYSMDDGYVRMGRTDAEIHQGLEA